MTTEMADTRASGAISWLAGVATAMSRGGLYKDKEQIERLDAAIRAQVGMAAEGAKEDARYAAALHLVNAAGETLRAACAYAIAGDTEGAARCSHAAYDCLIAIRDPLGDKHADVINKLAFAGEDVADAAGIVVKRAIELSGPGALAAVARAIAADSDMLPSQVRLGPIKSAAFDD